MNRQFPIDSGLIIAPRCILEYPEMDYRIDMFSFVYVDVQDVHKETPAGKILKLYQYSLSGYRPRDWGNPDADNDLFLFNKIVTKDILMGITPQIEPFIDRGYVLWYGPRQRVSYAFCNHYTFGVLHKRGINTFGYTDMPGHIQYCKYDHPLFQGHKPFSLKDGTVAYYTSRFVQNVEADKDYRFGKESPRIIDIEDYIEGERFNEPTVAVQVGDKIEEA